MELVAVVIGGQPRRPLPVRRRGLAPGSRRDRRDAPAAAPPAPARTTTRCFPARSAAGCARSSERSVRFRRAQPLELGRQSIVKTRAKSPHPARRSAPGSVSRRHQPAALQIQPVIRAPDAFRQPRLAPQWHRTAHAAPATAARTDRYDRPRPRALRHIAHAPSAATGCPARTARSSDAVADASHTARQCSRDRAMVTAWS